MLRPEEANATREANNNNSRPLRRVHRNKRELEESKEVQLVERKPQVVESFMPTSVNESSSPSAATTASHLRMLEAPYEEAPAGGGPTTVRPPRQPAHGRRNRAKRRQMSSQRPLVTVSPAGLTSGDQLELSPLTADEQPVTEFDGVIGQSLGEEPVGQAKAETLNASPIEQVAAVSAQNLDGDQQPVGAPLVQSTDAEPARERQKTLSRRKKWPPATAGQLQQVPAPEQNPLRPAESHSSVPSNPQVGDQFAFEQQRQRKDSELAAEQHRLGQLIKLSERILAEKLDQEQQWQTPARPSDDPVSFDEHQNIQIKPVRGQGLQSDPTSGEPSELPNAVSANLLNSALINKSTTLAARMVPQIPFLLPQTQAMVSSNSLPLVQLTGNWNKPLQSQLEDSFYDQSNGRPPSRAVGELPKAGATGSKQKKLRASGSQNHANFVATPSGLLVDVSQRPDLLLAHQIESLGHQAGQQQPASQLLNLNRALAQAVGPYSRLPHPIGSSRVARGGQALAGQQTRPLVAMNNAPTAYVPIHSVAASTTMPHGPINRFGTTKTLQSSLKRHMMSGQHQNNRKASSSMNFDDSPNGQSAATSDPMWSDTQNQEDDYQQSPQTIQITAVPNGLVGNGWNNGFVNGWNGWGGGPWNGRQVLLVNRQPTVGNEWRSWALPIAIILALPLVLGALFVPVFLKSVMFLIQILQMLGLLMPPHQLAGHLTGSASHSSTTG